VVLGSFRDAAQDRPDLTQVAAALDRSVTRAIGPEDFVTAVAVQVPGDDSAMVLNCGHPAPLLVRAGRATELDPPEPAPPLAWARARSRCGWPWRWATGSCCTPTG
jgi:sigma-B regulation protein RsbU (phosphoserine phosphatase)